MKSIFTYGTLRRSERNHIVLQQTNHVFVNEDAIPAAKVGMWGDDIPLIVPSDSGETIPGEVFEVDADGLARLDRFEGVPYGMYERKTVTTLSGREVEVYFPGAELLHRG